MRTTVILLLMAVTTAMVWMYVRAQNERRQMETMERRLKELEKRFLAMKLASPPPLGAMMAQGEERGQAPKEATSDPSPRVEVEKDEFVWRPPLGEKVQPQPAHKGTVLAVDQNAGTCVISLGSEDGVKQGFNYIISRDDKYVAMIEITDVQAKQSAGKRLEDISKDDIRKGDDAMNGR